jgi:hypothetical protein
MWSECEDSPNTFEREFHCLQKPKASSPTAPNSVIIAPM